MAEGAYLCYFCSKPVSQTVHEQHIQLLEEMSERLGAEHPWMDNAFVHMAAGQAENFDAEGWVVVCDRDFVRELAEAL